MGNESEENEMRRGGGISTSEETCNRACRVKQRKGKEKLERERERGEKGKKSWREKEKERGKNEEPLSDCEFCGLNPRHD